MSRKQYSSQIGEEILKKYLTAPIYIMSSDMNRAYCRLWSRMLVGEHK